MCVPYREGHAMKYSYASMSPTYLKKYASNRMVHRLFPSLFSINIVTLLMKPSQ